MSTTVQRPAAAIEVDTGQRVVLHGVAWETYERLLADHLGRRSPRFAYDRGELEIVAPTGEHERDNWFLARSVEIIAEELGIEFDNRGMTTFRRADVASGFEADTAFYLQHAAQVRDLARIDLAVAPPPDLVIEVDVTHTSLVKFPIYGALGVPEIWRCEDGKAAIYAHRGGAYEAVQASAALPFLTREVLNDFLVAGRSRSRLDWIQMVRKWARAQSTGDH